MNFSKWRRVIVGVLVVGGMILFLQWRSSASLRHEIQQEKTRRDELGALHAEHSRLTASQLSTAELERLRADHDAVVRLRGELAVLKKQFDETRRLVAESGALPPPSTPKEAATLAAMAIPETDWKNAGRDSPGAAVETALWAATVGDLDAVAATFVLEGSARTKAETLFAELPAAARAQCGSPEKLVALFTAKDVPVSVRLGGAGGGENHVEMTLRMEPEGGGVKEAKIVLRRFSDGWRLVVPERAIERYRTILKGQEP